MNIKRKEVLPEISGEEEAQWDIKRIIIGIIILLFLVILGGYFSVNTFGRPQRPGNILGVSQEKNLTSQNISKVNLPKKEDIEKIISETRESISKITSDNLTSSQAAIQKIIANLQILQGAENGPAGIFCEFVCKK